MEKDHTFEITVSQSSLDLVIRTFQGMHDHFLSPSVVDFAAIDRELKEIADIIQMLKKHQHGNDDASISFGPRDWATLTILLQHADDCLPGVTQDDLIIIESLSDHCFDLEEAWENSLKQGECDQSF